MDQQIIRTTISKLHATGEWIVRAYTAEGRYPRGDYYATDRQDARSTANAMVGSPMHLNGNK